MTLVINDSEKAARLARAILADLALYNGAKIAAARDVRVDLAAEIGEGRELFRTRVAPEHHAVFEEELARWSPGGERGAPSPEVRTKERPAREHDDAKERNFGRTMMIVVTLLILSGLVGALMIQRHERAEHETHEKHEGSRR